MKLLAFLGIIVFLIGSFFWLLKLERNSIFEASFVQIQPNLASSVNNSTSSFLLDQNNKLSDLKVKFIPSDILYQGEAFRIELENFGEEVPAVIYFRDKEYPVFFYNNKPTAVIPLAVDEKTGTAEIRVGEKEFFVSVLPGIFHVEEIAPPKPLPPKISARRLREKNTIDAVYKTVRSEIFFDSPFIFPLDNSFFDTSPFGVQRLIKNTGQKISFHNGVDFRAPIGTPVKAVNDGVVALAENYLFEGGFVILDHGFGINSVYLHLSRINVKNGDKVAKGQIIGLSGNSGYSTGPHLHFTIKINGIAVDPIRFLTLW